MVCCSPCERLGVERIVAVATKVSDHGLLMWQRSCNESDMLLVPLCNPTQVLERNCLCEFIQIDVNNPSCSG